MTDIYLSKPDVGTLLIYCKGCRYFDPSLEVSLICSIVGWYRKKNIEEVVKYVKRCPCNKKCLVKPSCMEENCPIWRETVFKILNERSFERIKEKC
jgi:hypothetical protein